MPSAPRSPARRLTALALHLLALGLIGGGLSCFSPPAACAVCGLLVWIDLQLPERN